MKCYVCDRENHLVKMRRIIPKIEGGIYEPSNLVPLCSKCHQVLITTVSKIKSNIIKWKEHGVNKPFEKNPRFIKLPIKSREIARKWLEDWERRLSK